MTTTLETTAARQGWVPYAAIASGAGFLLMSVLVFATEDAIDTPAVVLYLGSILLALAAAIGQGARVGGGKGALVAIGLCLAVVAWVMGVGDLLSPLFEQISDKEYVGDQGPIALLGLVLVGLGARARS
jgi:hypothetical protein